MNTVEKEQRLAELIVANNAATAAEAKESEKEAAEAYAKQLEKEVAAMRWPFGDLLREVLEPIDYALEGTALVVRFELNNIKVEIFGLNTPPDSSAVPYMFAYLKEEDEEAELDDFLRMPLFFDGREERSLLNFLDIASKRAKDYHNQSQKVSTTAPRQQSCALGCELAFPLMTPESPMGFGLTKREYFAAQLLPVFAGKMSYEEAASETAAYVEAMLAVLDIEE